MTNLEKMIDLMKQLNTLWNEGMGKSPEADAIRDESDPIWLALTEMERKQLREWALINM